MTDRSVTEAPEWQLANVEAFLDRYGLSNTSGHRHWLRKNALALARADIAALRPDRAPAVVPDVDLSAMPDRDLRERAVAVLSMPSLDSFERLVLDLITRLTEARAEGRGALDVERLAEALTHVPTAILGASKTYNREAAEAIAAEYHAHLAQREPAESQLNLHGYTCGICSWGRGSSPRSQEQYESHMAHEHAAEPAESQGCRHGRVVGTWCPGCPGDTAAPSPPAESQGPGGGSPDDSKALGFMREPW